MTIKVTEALDVDTAKIVTIIRQTKGGYVDGLFVEGQELFIKALASVQPATPQQIKSVPEGERSADLRAIYINKPIYVAGQFAQVSDSIKFKNTRYKIIAVGDWDDFGYTYGIGVVIK